MFAYINKAIANFVGIVVAIAFLGLTIELGWLVSDMESIVNHFGLTGEWVAYSIGIAVVLYTLFIFLLGGLAVHTANYYQLGELKAILKDIRDGRNAYNSDPEADRRASRVDPSL